MCSPSKVGFVRYLTLSAARISDSYFSTLCQLLISCSFGCDTETYVRIDLKIRSQSRVGFFTLKYKNRSSDLTVLQSHYFSIWSFLQLTPLLA